jgi:hypothetical protein
MEDHTELKLLTPARSPLTCSFLWAKSAETQKIRKNKKVVLSNPDLKEKRQAALCPGWGKVQAGDKVERLPTQSQNCPGNLQRQRDQVPSLRGQLTNQARVCPHLPYPKEGAGTHQRCQEASEVEGSSESESSPSFPEQETEAQ